jgi:hypothetical protein
MTTRLMVNLSQTYMATYLTHSLHLPKVSLVGPVWGVAGWREGALCQHHSPLCPNRSSLPPSP